MPDSRDFEVASRKLEGIQSDIVFFPFHKRAGTSSLVGNLEKLREALYFQRAKIFP